MGCKLTKPSKNLPKGNKGAWYVTEIGLIEQMINANIESMKTPSIQIHDAQRRVDGKRVNGYRVKLVAKNGEILQVSEVLNTTAAVKKHLVALRRCIVDDTNELLRFREIHDHTISGIFCVE